MIENFAKELEQLRTDKSLSAIDAVLYWCDSHGYEIESAAMLIKKDPVLQQKIKIEAEASNLLKEKRGSCLPL